MRVLWKHHSVGAFDIAKYKYIGKYLNTKCSFCVRHKFLPFGSFPFTHGTKFALLTTLYGKTFNYDLCDQSSLSWQGNRMMLSVREKINLILCSLSYAAVYGACLQYVSVCLGFRVFQLLLVWRSAITLSEIRMEPPLPKNLFLQSKVVHSIKGCSFWNQHH